MANYGYSAAFVPSYASFAVAQPVFVAQPYAVQSVAVFNSHRDRRANVQVNAVGADVRVRRGIGGSTVVRVR